MPVLRIKPHVIETLEEFREKIPPDDVKTKNEIVLAIQRLKFNSTSLTNQTTGMFLKDIYKNIMAKELFSEFIKDDFVGKFEGMGKYKITPEDWTNLITVGGTRKRRRR